MDPVQILLDKGLVSVNESNAEYRSALQAASYNGHQKVVQAILDTDTDFNTQGWLSALSSFTERPKGNCTDASGFQCRWWTFDNAIKAAS